MFRTITLLALVAACSAFNMQVPQSILEQDVEKLPTTAGLGAGRNLYFPCDGLTVNHVQNLDLERVFGRWYATNVAFAVTHKINPASVQREISTNIGCQKLFVDVTNTAINITSDIITRQPVPQNSTHGQVINGTDIRYESRAFLVHPGDNGRWLYRTDLGNNVTFFQDLLWVATDYSSFGLWYTCSDVPVPGSLDTKREQQWGLNRRWPANLNPIELAALKLLALKNGIFDADHLYTYPTDLCWSQPTGPTAVPTTPTTTTTPTTETTTVTTTTVTTTTQAP